MKLHIVYFRTMDWTLATDVVAALVGLAALAFAVYQIALLVKGFKEGRI